MHKVVHHTSKEYSRKASNLPLDRQNSASIQDLNDSKAQGVTAKYLLDLNNISVWDFFDNVSKDDTDEPTQRTNRFGGSLGMAVGARAPSESQRSKQKASKRSTHQLQELFKNDMINTTVLPKIKNDSQNYNRLNQLEDFVDVFSDLVERASVTTNSYGRIICYFMCCCKCVCFRNKCRRFLNQNMYRSSNDMLFGELTQSRLIMEKNFEGK